MVAGSLENIVDKRILIDEPERVDVLSAMFYRNLAYYICILLLGVTGVMGRMSFVFTMPMVVLAIFYPCASYAYDYFLRNTEMSRFSAITHTFPIFFIFFDNVFFHISYTWIQIVGVFLLVGGVILFSYDVRTKGSAFSWKGIGLLMVYMAANMYIYVLFKMNSGTLNSISFYASSWTLLMVFYGFLLLVFRRSSRILRETAGSHGFLGKTFVAKVFDALGSVFYLEAFGLASLTAVSAFTSLSPLVMLILLSLVSAFTRKGVAEDFSSKTFALKATATGMLVIGGLCMYGTPA